VSSPMKVYAPRFKPTISVIMLANRVAGFHHPCPVMSGFGSPSSTLR
jgi:hypothetical protein